MQEDVYWSERQNVEGAGTRLREKPSDAGMSEITSVYFCLLWKPEKLNLCEEEKEPEWS